MYKTMSGEKERKTYAQVNDQHRGGEKREREEREDPVGPY